MGRTLVRRLTLVVLLSGVLPCFAAGQWVEVRSPHLSVTTDAGERRGRELALQFEQMRAIFANLLQRNRVNFPAPLRIVAFENSGDFRRYRPAGPAGSADASAFFQAGEDCSYLALDLSSKQGVPAALHQYAHLLLDANYPRTQPWFDEGFSEYFSTIRISTKEVEAGRPPASAALLQSAPLLPVAELLAAGRDSKLYNENGDSRSAFHAQSWLLVRYLLEDGKLDEAADYFDLVHNQRLPIAVAIRRAFGMEPAKLDRLLRDAANPVRSSPHTSEAPAGLDETGATAATLDQADSQAALAELLLHSPGHLGQAINEFQAVLALAPRNAAAHRGLGYADLARQRFAEASEHFRQALAADSKDAGVHYYLALLAERQASAAGGKSLAAGAKIDDPWTMKREAEAALALAPDLAGGYRLLAAAEGSIGDLEAAIAAMKKAVRLYPRNDAYVADLAQYELLAQKWDDAAALLEYLKESDEPRIAASAADDLRLLPALRRTPPPVVARRERPNDWSQYDDPQWRRTTPAAPPPVAREEAAPPPDTRPVKFLKGTLLRVDCSRSPAAVLVVLSGKKTWKLRAADVRYLVLVGADSFSCDWRGREVAVNYREGGQGTGDVVSLEVE